MLEVQKNSKANVDKKRTRQTNIVRKEAEKKLLEQNKTTNLTQTTVKSKTTDL